MVRHFTIIIGTVLIALPAAAATPPYQLTDLGTIGGSTSTAKGMNGAGDVVGASTTASGEQHAFLYHAGTMIDLGLLGGVQSTALAINNQGDVLAVSFTNPLPSLATQAFLLHADGTLSEIPPQSSNRTFYTSIDDNGDAVGQGYPLGFLVKGVVYNHGTGAAVDASTLLSMPSQWSGIDAVVSINNHGDFIGDASIPVQTQFGTQNQEEAFLYRNGQIISPVPISSSVASSNANALNDRGDFVGTSSLPSTGTAAVWPQGFAYINGFLQQLALPGIGNAPAAINNSGDVVGTYYTQDSGTEIDHAFLYTNGVGVDLNTLLPADSGWTLEAATAINDNGQIAGYGINPVGQTEAFLLTPTPEPASLSLLAFAALPLLRRRRR